MGSIRVRLRFDPAQRPDVVVVPKGGNYDRGNCANTAFVRARLTDAGEGAAFARLPRPLRDGLRILTGRSGGARTR